MSYTSYLIESYFYHLGYSQELRERVLTRALFLTCKKNGLEAEASRIASHYSLTEAFLPGMDRVVEEFALAVLQAHNVTLHEGIMAMKCCLFNLPAYTENGQSA